MIWWPLHFCSLSLSFLSLFLSLSLPPSLSLPLSLSIFYTSISLSFSTSLYFHASIFIPLSPKFSISWVFKTYLNLLWQTIVLVWQWHLLSSRQHRHPHVAWCRYCSFSMSQLRITFPEHRIHTVKCKLKSLTFLTIHKNQLTKEVYYFSISTWQQRVSY